MRSKPRKQSLARDHKESANERKEARTLPAEQRKQEFATRRHVSRQATQDEKHSARSSRRDESGSEFELPI
jgi:hypothetical protein